MSNTLRLWLHGVGSAFIGGAASSVSAAVVDPEKFNLSGSAGISNLLKMAVVSGIVSACFYLKRSPLPGDDQPAAPTPTNPPTP